MKPEWIRIITQALLTHFQSACARENIKSTVKDRKINDVPRCEIRTLDLGSTQIDAIQWELSIAVNVLCMTKSGLDLTTPSNIYAIEDLLGKVCSFFVAAVPTELGCLRLIPVGGEDLRIDRPRQVGSTVNIEQAAVTGYYVIRIEGN